MPETFLPASRHPCPFAGCDWSFDLRPSWVQATVEVAWSRVVRVHATLLSHFDGDHEGWSIEQLKDMAETSHRSYDEACRNAACNQGLGPVMERLTAEGIRHELLQTGGFCMVVEINLPGEARLGVTTETTTGEDGWLVCAYDAEGKTEGTVRWDGDEAGAVQRIREVIANAVLERYAAIVKANTNASYNARRAVMEDTDGEAIYEVLDVADHHGLLPADRNGPLYDGWVDEYTKALDHYKARLRLELAGDVLRPGTDPMAVSCETNYQEALYTLVSAFVDDVGQLRVTALQEGQQL